jgi:Ca2+-binding RTX toxin-like protein
MVSTATVPGGGGTTVTLTFENSNVPLAQSIALSITKGVNDGTLIPVVFSGAPLAPPPSGKELEVIIKADGPVFLPSGTGAVVDVAKDSIVFGSGAPNELVLSNAKNFTFFTEGGSGTIVTGFDTNRIVENGNVGSWNIATGGGDDTVIINGGTNTVSAGEGRNSILLQGGANVVSTTGHDVIQAVSGADTIVSSGNDPVITGGTADIFYVGGQAATTLVGGQGTDTVFAAAGGLFEGGSKGGNFIFGGDGPTKIIGGGDGDQLFASGDFHTEIDASSGNETLNGAFARADNTFRAGPGSDMITGGSGNDKLFAGTGAATMTGGSGNDKLFAGTGAATMTGGGGADTFSFVKGDAAHVTILDFSQADGDTVMLQGFKNNDVNNAIKHQASDAAGTTITLSDHTTITFADISSVNKSFFS